jgi:electron transport complex protein RnfC
LASPLGELTPLVQVGETVAAGQKIAEHPDAIHPPRRSSISGEVKRIGQWPTGAGAEATSVTIEANGDETTERPPVEEAAGDERDLFQLLYEAGIREPDPYVWPFPIRIAKPSLTPPILFPYAPELLRPIDLLIINGLDRQPGVAVRRNSLGSGSLDFLDCISILKRISSPAGTMLAVAKDQPLRAGFERDVVRLGVEVLRCPNIYPIGLEPVLVQFATGKEIPQPGGDSRSLGVAVVDVATILRALQAVRDGLPVLESVLQVTAPNLGGGMWVQIREGMLLEELLEHITVPPESLAKAVLGGPFLGHAQHRLDVPLTQETECIVLQRQRDVSTSADEPCMNCGTCVRLCPMRLLPNELSRYCEYGKFREAERMDLFCCIECGICAYVCPVKRPMVQLFRFGKQELLASREES